MKLIELLDEKCWKGYQKKGTKMYAKGGEVTSFGLSFTKDDYDVNVDANDGENNIEVDVNIKKSDNLEKAINDNLDYVIGETLAIKLYFSENLDVGDIIEFDNIKTRITIKKV